MSTEGEALSHLRDIYYILTHDLAASQLDDLAQSNWNAQAEPPAVATPAQKVAALAAAVHISPIIERLAPTAVLYGSAVEAADQLTSSGISATFYLIILVYVLILVISGLVILLIFYILKKVYHDKHVNFAELVPALGKIILAWMAANAFMVVWLLLLLSRRADLKHNADILRVGYWNVHNVLSGAYAIRFSAAVQAGTLQDLVSRSFTSQGNTLSPGPDCAEDGVDYDAQPTKGPCSSQVTGCSTTVPTLDTVVADSCYNEIFLLLTLLQTLKTNGTDSYDRSAMWASISTGIEAVRATIAVSANADTTPTPVLPTSGTGTPGTPAFPALAYTYVATDGTTTQISTASAVAIPAVGVQSTVPDDVIASLAPIMQSAGINVAARVLAAEPGTPSVPDKGLRKYLDPFFDRMTAQILPLLQSLPTKLNINDHRDSIEASLSVFYGAQYPKIQFELLSIIAKVQKAQDAPPLAIANIYVDAPTMAARIKDLGPSAWSDLVASIDVTQKAVQSFQMRFKLPAHQPSPTIKIMTALMVILTLAGFVVLLMFISHTLNSLFALTLEKQNAARYILVAACIYALGVVISSSVVERLGYRVGHNWDALRRNGQTLSHALGAAELAGVKIEGETSSVPPMDAQAYIDAATAAVQAYDDCNAVTNGASVMSFPTMEIVIYGTVVVVVVASALFGINELNPAEKLSNIRSLMRLHERVMDGESPGGMTQQLECCSPKQSVWEIMMWLAVVVLFCLNIYVMSSVKKTDNNYSQSLMLHQACI